MNLKLLDEEFSICRLNGMSGIDLKQPFTFLSVTDEEISLVCPAQSAPKNCAVCQTGWIAFRIEGVLDFSLTGILYKISSVLAQEKIGIFAVSTYNTDYILIKKENKEPAVRALKQANYMFI